MSNTEVMDLSVMEKVVIKGDLSSLTPQERFVYYTKLCESLGLNPMTKPFDYLMLDKKLVLYAKKDCTDQLRKMQKISVNIASRERIGDVYCVTARATTPDGRFDESMGVVSLTKKETIWDEMRQRSVPTGNFLPLSGEELANALMKAETKSKRRVTLSLAGLGIMDESEIESIENGQRIIIDETDGAPPQPQGTESAPQPDKNEKSTGARKTTGKEGVKPGNQQPPVQPDSKAPSPNVYQLLDYKTGTSPGGIIFAQMKVTNLTTGEQEVVIVKEADVITETEKINNTSKFHLDIIVENGFKLVNRIQIMGDAA